MSHNHFSTTEMTKFYDSIHTPALQKPIFPVPKQPVDANNATCLRLEKLSQKSKPLHPFTRPPPPFPLKFPTAELGATASPTFPAPLLREIFSLGPLPAPHLQIWLFHPPFLIPPPIPPYHFHLYQTLPASPPALL